MRGALVKWDGQNASIRIIPADAGSTSWLHIKTIQAQDHPRGCGEHARRCEFLCQGLGSSPRMRGAHLAERADVCDRRIIPADAGSTLCLLFCQRQCRDHPRGCGEHFVDAIIGAKNQGSSPRMRGALTEINSITENIRIIPADAGSTQQRLSSHDTAKDHPRGCGEHLFSMPKNFTHSGSSPRMRGALPRESSSFAGIRIIPADAGSTSTADHRHDFQEDHPRGCGEHPPRCRPTSRPRGSSPRMRGARVKAAAIAATGRIIPADAGSTPAGRPWSPAGRDHPRGCGEHSILPLIPRISTGSSPRMRGAPS